MFAAFYRAGALVFGGGHVVLPLLQAAIVPMRWVSGPDILAGYGAAQAMPGPLFTFAAYLGAAMSSPPNGVPGAALCLAAIYLPSFFLVLGALPLWAVMRQNPNIRGGLSGVNAAVVGLLAAALYRPIMTSAIHSLADILTAAASLMALVVWKAPSWLVVVLTFVAVGIISKMS